MFLRLIKSELKSYKKFLKSRAFLAPLFILALLLSSFPQFLSKPQVARAASGDVILLWDTANGAVPAGWTCISCTGGDAFFGVFPRAAATYGASTAGADTVSHGLTSPSATAGAASAAGGAAGAVRPASTHTHDWTTIASTASGDIKPPFQNLNFITANNPSVLPANIIAVFDAAPDSNWTRYTALDGDYLRGDSDNATGGASTHTHSISGTSGGPNNTLASSNKTTVATDAHTHSISGTTGTANNEPPFLEVLFYRNSSGGNISIPAGLIAFFDATPPSGWTVVSDASPWLNSFLKGAATYGGTGGSAADHNHNAGSITITSGGPSAANQKISNSGTTGADTTHTHDVTYTISATSSLPVYRDVILAKKAAAAPTVSCSSSTASTAFGTLSTGSIIDSSPNASTTMSCSDTTSGCTLYVKDAGNASNPGLATTSPAYLIPSPNAAFSASTTLSIGVEGYGIQATTTSAGLTVAARYLLTGNDVGGFTLTNQEIASSTADITDAEAVVTHKAAISDLTIAANYEDTITYECVVN